LVAFGTPFRINPEWKQMYKEDEKKAVKDFTTVLQDSLQSITINAPDWATLRLKIS
jgi:hypothetical protein